MSSLSCTKAHSKSKGNQILVYDLKSGAIQQVPFSGKINIDREPIAWSPDGQCLIFWHDNLATAYRVADGALQQKAYPAQINFSSTNEVAPSLDGHWWAWQCNTDICVMTPDGKQIHGDGLNLPHIEINGRNSLLASRQCDGHLIVKLLHLLMPVPTF